jgi:hypothetical protein
MPEYDQNENTKELTPPRRGSRKSLKLGSKLTVKDIESDIEKGESD